MLCFKPKCFECFLNKLFCRVENFSLTTAEKKNNSSDIFTLFYSWDTCITLNSLSHICPLSGRHKEMENLAPSYLYQNLNCQQEKCESHLIVSLMCTMVCHSVTRCDTWTNRLMSDHLIWPHCEVKSQINPFHPSGLIQYRHIMAVCSIIVILRIITQNLYVLS